ncbi:MAG: flagellar hook-length control protein FliK [Methylophilaceae bacterium]|nr:flagellar hook-length control protein FliK [Methylophilaceae bacterium]
MISISADTAGTAPVSKVTPLIPVRIVGDIAGETDFRLEQFRLVQTLSEQLVKGQVYQGKVVAKLDEQIAVVTLNGTAVKMALGDHGRLGESVSLKFLGEQANPAFLLTPAAINQDAELTTISHAAQQISQFFGSTQENKAPARFEAQTPVTSSPLNLPQVVANDLKHALAQSGLFYESHLVENLEGKRPLSALLQEPQNQAAAQNQGVAESKVLSLQNQMAATLNALVPQQLNILENQKLSWHGEVWPNQLMEWDVGRKNLPEITVQNQKQSTSAMLENEQIDSKITLHLPNLGSVTARLNLQNGKMRIQIMADELATSTLLKDHSAALAQSLEASGQALDFLSVLHHEQATQP